MREEKPKSPSQKNKSAKTKSWFWPVVYSGIAIVFVGMIWGYNALLKEDSPGLADIAGKNPKDSAIVETNAAKEMLKYPFKETLLDDVAVLQEYYDVKADETMRENALLVFDQTYEANTGLSISVEGQPFEIVASLSGTVENIITDPFKGSEIVLTHADGLKTIYRSVTGILVKKDEEVLQGQPIATSTENEWNPTAGIHLHFEVQKNGVTVNPRSYLGFQ
ncbi:M23 family metallopeptidase [Sporosarcina limicola]|uniref:Stage II sporulation protein Q n=1 Tax=Sporosarcina limicola TaxID=34101 RepID=A0A927R419_9BACL|nr:M23 family metallopeptidase [Sporosarcina limicola]MBE1555691.1 stage II sporulation protein Q [Sporosarcina limicola]